MKFVIGRALTILSWDNLVTAFFRKKVKTAPQPWQAIAQRFCSIQVQCYNSSELVFQYAVTDKTYYIRDLGDTIFVAPEAEPSGTSLTATEAAFKDYVADVVHEAHTLYIAVPEIYADSGYTYKMNIRCTDDSYPKSARTFEETTETFNGLKVYSYTFKAEYTEMYDELGINRIE